MKAAVGCLASLALAACDNRRDPVQVLLPAKPPEALVRQIERRMQQEPCIGSLSRWSRHYRYGAPHEVLDESSVSITYKQASKTDPEGSFIDLPPLMYDSSSGTTLLQVEIDDRPIDFVSATYHRRSHTINLQFCGHSKGG